MCVDEFDQWSNLKKDIDGKRHSPPLVSVGDIWWIATGKNIGYEINGKSEKFSRPVIIYKKLSHHIYLVLPTTTQEKDGTWFVPFTHKDKYMVACLHQAKTIDYRRLYSKIGTLDDTNISNIKTGFDNLYK